MVCIPACCYVATYGYCQQLMCARMILTESNGDDEDAEEDDDRGDRDDDDTGVFHKDVFDDDEEDEGAHDSNPPAQSVPSLIESSISAQLSQMRQEVERRAESEGKKLTQAEVKECMEWDWSRTVGGKKLTADAMNEALDA